MEAAVESKGMHSRRIPRGCPGYLKAAKTNRLNPAKYRGNTPDVRKGLREGKRDKKKKDKD